MRVDFTDRWTSRRGYFSPREGRKDRRERTKRGCRVAQRAAEVSKGEGRKRWKGPTLREIPGRSFRPELRTEWWTRNFGSLNSDRRKLSTTCCSPRDFIIPCILLLYFIISKIDRKDADELVVERKKKRRKEEEITRVNALQMQIGLINFNFNRAIRHGCVSIYFINGPMAIISDWCIVNR